MNPLYSVFIYSKYSANCKKLLDLITSSGVDFETTVRLTVLNCDNKKARERITRNKNIEVTIVPCILVVYGGGSVEKYDGTYAFNWVENIIQKYAPPPPPKPMYIPEQVVEPLDLPPQQQPVQPSDFKGGYSTNPSNIPSSMPIGVTASAEDQIQQRYNEDAKYQKEQKEDVPPNMKPINSKNVTLLEDDIPDIDRHRTVQPPKRLRQDVNSYIEDEDLFSGEQPDYRKEPANAVRPTHSPTATDPRGTMARVKEMEREREQMESNMSKTRMPFESRRP